MPLPKVNLSWLVMGGGDTASLLSLAGDGRYWCHKSALSDRWLEDSGGGTSTANEQYLNKDERYPVPQIGTPYWWWEVPGPQTSIICMGMRDTGTANEHNWLAMGGTSAANEHYLNKDEIYRYRKLAYLTGDVRYQCRKWALSEWIWKIPVTQMSIIWQVMGGTVTQISVTWPVMGGTSTVQQMSIIWQVTWGTSTANEHSLNKDERKWTHLTGDERNAANGDDLSAALTQLHQHWLDIAAQLFDTVVLRLCLQNLRICLEAR